ncbi:hypothetical protein KIPB_006465 [Kipferlia bialata]|uniref:Uncharacterized protein n=1 Tax=Kipferlia bialata TaxID=797122 RepID=A0A391NME6_9EUKA|nr:hypothetical protein KIPB_006465 [Kipferlia bialata]|eukprot:g6465.t1
MSTGMTLFPNGAAAEVRADLGTRHPSAARTPKGRRHSMVQWPRAPGQGATRRHVPDLKSMGRIHARDRGPSPSTNADRSPERRQSLQAIHHTAQGLQVRR